MTTTELLLKYVRSGSYFSRNTLASALAKSYVRERGDPNACRKLIQQAEEDGLIYQDEGSRRYRARR